MAAVDSRQAGEDAVGAETILLPVRQQPLLGEGAKVDQPLDALANRQLALLGGLLVVALRAAGEGGFESLGKVGHGGGAYWYETASRKPIRSRS